MNYNLEKEMNIYLDYPPSNTKNTLKDVWDAILNEEDIDTGLTYFCSTDMVLEYGYKLIIHSGWETIRFEGIQPPGCSKEIRPEHNLERMLLAGKFCQIPKRCEL